MALSHRIAKAAILMVALGLTVVLGVGIWRGKVQQDRLESAAATEPVPEAAMRLADMEYTEMQQGRRIWTLKASEARYFQEEQKTELTAVRVTFFLENGEEVLLEGEEGILFAGSKNIELRKAVQAILPDGYVVTTDRAFYDHAVRTLSSETALELAGPDILLKGARWRYLFLEEMGVLEGGVTAKVVLLPSPTNSVSQ